MGKANRIRNQRASTVLNPSVKPAKKNNQGMPSWAVNLIAIAITAFVVITIALSLLSANGVFGRLTTAMSSDNFRVNENVMKYFYSEAASNADKTATVDQIIATAKSDVKTMLALCEEAHKRGIELDAADEENIDLQIQMYELYGQYYGYGSVNAFISASFGKGVNKSDVKKALSLQALASKCGAELSDELLEKITAGDIDAKYLENKNDYDIVDYTQYTYKVTYKDAAEAVLGKSNYTKQDETDNAAAILEKFKELVEKAKADAKAFNEITTPEELKAYIIDREVDSVYDDEYDNTIMPGHTEDDGHDHDDDAIIKLGDLPSVEDLKTIREKSIAHLKTLLKEDKKYEKLTVDNAEAKNATLFEITVTADFAEAYEEIMEGAYDSAKTVVAKYVVEKATYKDTDKIVKWAFEEGENGRKAGDVTTFEEGSGAEGEAYPESATALKTYSITAVRSIKTRYKDATITRELGVMLFGTKDAATAAIAKLKAGMTLEEFEAICNELTGTYRHYENYVKGNAASDVFDEWVFDEKTTVGTFTATPIEVTEGKTYAVAIYTADKEAVWYLDVRADILEENYEAAIKTLENTYVIKANDKVIGKLGA